MLVGKWQAVEDQSVMEFYSDGTISTQAKVGNSNRPINGTWSILNDGRLKLDFIIMEQNIPIILTLSIEDDKMTTTTEEGEVVESIRIK
jgi:hypothetical protein